MRNDLHVSLSNPEQVARFTDIAHSVVELHSGLTAEGRAYLIDKGRQLNVHPIDITSLLDIVSAGYPILPSSLQGGSDAIAMLRCDWEFTYYPMGNDSLARGVLTLQDGHATDLANLESHIVLLLDASGSMNKPDKYPLMLKAVDELLNTIGNGCYFTLILFSSSSQTLCRAFAGHTARQFKAKILSSIEDSPVKFYQTNLACSLVKHR